MECQRLAQLVPGADRPPMSAFTQPGSSAFTEIFLLLHLVGQVSRDGAEK